MSDLNKATRASRRTENTQHSDGEDQPRGNEDKMLDEVSAKSTAPKGDRKNKPEGTPQPQASPAYQSLYGQGQGTKSSTPHATSAPRITMANIRDMMEQNVQDITRNLEERHTADMVMQQQATRVLAEKLAELQAASPTTRKTGEQASPFETPKAVRPQDVAYKQILTEYKAKDKVKSTPEVQQGRPVTQD